MKTIDERQKMADASAKKYADVFIQKAPTNLEYVVRNSYKKGWCDCNKELLKEIEILRSIILKSMTLEYLEKLIDLFHDEDELNEAMTKLHNEIIHLQNRKSGIANKISRRAKHREHMMESHKALLAHKIINE